MWPVLQQTGAAVAAWVIAEQLVQHRQPIFAPMAALVGLNASRGERGTNAFRLLLGVAYGIVTAEAATALLGYRNATTLAAALFAAIMGPVALGAERIVIAQAGVSAILAVATGEPQAGPERLIDASIGVTVALVVSQLLLPAEPVALLRRAEAAALRQMAGALARGVDALELDDPLLATHVVEDLQDVGDRLAHLRSVRVSSSRSAHASPIWWTRVASVQRESEAAGRLELLGSECLVLTRTAVAAPPEGHRTLAPVLRRLSRILITLAAALDDAESRKHAGDQALTLVGELAQPRGGNDRVIEAVSAAVWGLAVDMQVFCGVGELEALDAVRAAARLPGP
jgi:uncharacterized membrane protein YgaE (UPF0421/DUF939 family)